MTAALRCDGPSCGVFVTDPDEADRWWRLERNGPSIEQPRHPEDLPEMPVMAMSSTEVEVNIGMDDDGAYIDDDPEPEMTEADLPFVVLHFCTDGCLAGWSATALALGLGIEVEDP